MPAPDRSPDELRLALEAAAADVPRTAGDPRAGVARAVRRQRATRVAAVMPVVVLLAVGGVALASATDDPSTEVAVVADDRETEGAAEPTTTDSAVTSVPDGPVTTLCAASGGDVGRLEPPDGLDGTGSSIPTTSTSLVGAGPDPCDPSTTTSFVPCPAGTIVGDGDGELGCIVVTTTSLDPAPPTTTADDLETTTSTSEPTPSADPFLCGGISPSGWPTTAAPNPMVLQCLLEAFATGSPATMVVVSYQVPDGNGADPVYRHEITYTVVEAGVVEVRTDWSSATEGPVGLVTTERCTGLSGTMVPEVSGCSPA